MAYAKSIFAFMAALFAAEFFLSFAGRNIQIDSRYYPIPHTYIIAALLFSLFSIALLYRQEIIAGKDSRIDWKMSLAIILICISSMALKRELVNFNMLLFFARYLLFAALIPAVFVFSFGFCFVKNTLKTLGKRLFFLPVIFALTIFFLLAMDYCWLAFAKLSLFPLSLVADIDFPHIRLMAFGVTIGKQCSGILSLSLFIMLALLVFFLEIKRIKAKQYFLAVFLSLPILVLINSLRILLLLIAGNISRDFALGFFHSGIGSILFIVCFALYLKLVYRTRLFLLPSEQS